MNGASIRAICGEKRDADWALAEIVADHTSGDPVLREVHNVYRGVFLAPREHPRIAGPEFVPGEPVAEETER